ncbi:MAG: hypothetical protein HY360_00660 [Verrucomicrobia bacterium]|nr:hypothetical protein [Verrucomicrobiota bacterium]
MKVHQTKRGQAMTEYIIIVAVVALAALTVFGFFGDTIRGKMNGVINALGGSSVGVTTEDVTAGSTQQKLKDLDQQGTPYDGTP